MHEVTRRRAMQTGLAGITSLIVPGAAGATGSPASRLPGSIALFTHRHHYVCAQPGEGGWEVRQAPIRYGSEKFTVEQHSGGRVALKGAHGRYVSARAADEGFAVKQMPHVNGWELFEVLTPNPNDPDRIGLKTWHGKFVSAIRDTGLCLCQTDHFNEYNHFCVENLSDMFSESDYILDPAATGFEAARLHGVTLSDLIRGAIRLIILSLGEPLRYQANVLTNSNAPTKEYGFSAEDMRTFLRHGRMKYKFPIQNREVTARNVFRQATRVDNRAIQQTLVIQGPTAAMKPTWLMSAPVGVI